MRVSKRILLGLGILLFAGLCLAQVVMLQRRPTTAAAFDPADLGSVILRYDFDYLALADGVAISNLTDLSGNNYHAQQGTAASMPFWSNDVSILNGKGFGVFENSRLFTNYSTKYNQPIHAYIVMRQRNVFPGNQVITDIVGAPSTLQITYSGNSLRLSAPNAWGGAATLTNHLSWMCIEGLFNMSNSIIRTNNIEYPRTGTGYSPGTNNMAGFNLGTRNDGGGVKLTGDVAYVIYYNRSNSAAESTQIYNWFKNRFGELP